MDRESFYRLRVVVDLSLACFLVGVSSIMVLTHEPPFNGDPIWILVGIGCAIPLVLDVIYCKRRESNRFSS